MKIARFFAMIFAVLGIILMLGTVVISFACLDRPVGVLENPDQAQRCSEQLQQYVNSGDFTAAAGMMYGQPSLGMEGVPQDACTAMIWEAYRSNVSLEYSGSLYLLDSELARDGVLTVLDVPALMNSVQVRTKTLLDQRIAAAQEDSEIYDADGNLRGDVTQQILQEATRQAIEQDVSCLSQSVTIRVIYRDGSWWILPDQTFLKTISGPNA